MPGACAPGWEDFLNRLREDVRRSHSAAERTGNLGRSTNRERGVRTTSRARGDLASGIQLDVRGQVRGQARSREAGGFAVFQRPLIFRSVDLAEVVDTSIGLRGRTGFHEVRNRDRSQQADDGHNNHDFNQGETRPTDVFVRFHLFTVFLYKAVWTSVTGGLKDYVFVQ